jgi:hypothetical protein
MSPQMRELTPEIAGDIDLYFNDMCALKMCEEELAQMNFDEN